MTWILTHSGRRFDLTVPDPNISASVIDPEDIAHSLSMQARFNGHTHTFYSVAQHCCLVADLVPEEYRLAALLHDATEAYIGDIVSPLKKILPVLRQIESRIWHAICHHFDISPDLPPCIHDADLVALATEKRDLTTPHPDDWPALIGTVPAAQRIRPWTQSEAKREYLDRLLSLIADDQRAAYTRYCSCTAEQYHLCCIPSDYNRHGTCLDPLCRKVEMVPPATEVDRR